MSCARRGPRSGLPAAVALLLLLTSWFHAAPPQASRPAELDAVLVRCLARLRAAGAVAGEKTERIAVPGRDPAKEEPAPAVPFVVQRLGCWRSGSEDFELRSDGKTIWTIQRGRKRYIRQDDFWTHDFGRHLIAGFEAALRAADADGGGRLPPDLRLSRAEFDGRACLAARFALPAGFDRVLYIDLATSWPAGTEQVQKDGTHVTAIYRNVRAEAPRPPAAFTWKPEADFVEIDTTRRVEPVAPGSIVADVTLEMQGGKPARLSELVAGQKALLLDFWFVDCPPCRRALPAVEALAGKLVDQKLALVGVNFGDKPERIAAFLVEEKHTLRVARNGAGANDLVKLLGVPSFPALFLIGPDLKVLWHEVGFERKKLEGALRDAGFELPDEKR